MSEEKLLTNEDLENGFKELQIETLNGQPLTIRLKAPRWRRRRELILDFQRVLDPYIFVRECLAEALGERTDFYLDKLTPDSIARIENYSIALCLGETYQKKMAALGKQVIDELTSGRETTNAISRNGSALSLSPLAEPG